MYETEDEAEDNTRLFKFEILETEKILCSNCNRNIEEKAYFVADLKAGKILYSYCQSCARKFQKVELVKHRKDLY